MRLVYIKLINSYSDKLTYQENVLPPRFVSMGYETHILVSPRENTDKGVIERNPCEYINNYGVHVHVIPFSKHFKHISKKFDYYDSLYNILEELKPDFIFSHSVQYLSFSSLGKYKRHHPEVTIVADNHADHIITPLNNIKRKFIQKFLFGTIIKQQEKYIDKFYGVSPSRAEYLYKVYGVNPNKIAVIPQMGDDNVIKKYDHAIERSELCDKYNLDEKNVIITFGAGNIDKKKNLLPLVEATEHFPNFELVIFGAFSNDVQSIMQSHLKKSNIHFIGKLNGENIYKLLIASDIAIYPGQHSVLWDNTVACGTPLCVRKWEGMDYFDISGNCIYLSDGTTNEIVNVLKEISEKNLVSSMREAAIAAKISFSATEIAKRIINLT